LDNLASGNYIVRIESAELSKTMKVVVVKW
jgi:hypothetical protein